MEFNRKAHPECLYASNPYHECASNCLERISQRKGKTVTKPQGSKVFNITGSFGKKKKKKQQIEYKPASSENASSSIKVFPVKNPETHSPHLPGKVFAQEENASSSSSYSSSFKKPSSSECSNMNECFSEKQDCFSQTIPLSPNNTPDSHVVEHWATTPEPINHEITDERRSFCVLGSPNSHDDDDYDHDDEDDDGYDVQEATVESAGWDAGVSVGRYCIKPALSSVLKSILDKHGDIAAYSNLKSTAILGRHLECLCAVVKRLKSTPFDGLTGTRLKEMISVVNDLEAANFDVAWLRGVLGVAAEVVEAVETRDIETERLVSILDSTRAELNVCIEELARKEEELARREEEMVAARMRVEDTRVRLGRVEMEIEQLRLNQVGLMVEKWRGQSYLDELL